MRFKSSCPAGIQKKPAGIQKNAAGRLITAARKQKNSSRKAKTAAGKQKTTAGERKNYRGTGGIGDLVSEQLNAILDKMSSDVKFRVGYSEMTAVNQGSMTVGVQSA